MLRLKNWATFTLIVSEPAPTQFLVLSCSQASLKLIHFERQLFRLLEQTEQWGDTTFWHRHIPPPEVSGRRCSPRRNWDGNRTTGTEKGWRASRAGSLTPCNVLNTGVENVQDSEKIPIKFGCRANMMLLIFHWQELICWKHFHLSSVTQSCNSLFDASLNHLGD